MEEFRNFVGERDFWDQQQEDLTERKMRSKIAARRRRQDPERREREREKNLMAMRRRREDPETREKERERNRIAMRLKRQDPGFREKEKQAMKMRRLTDPEVKEKDKIAHRIRRQSHDVHENEGYRRKRLAMQHLAQHFELAESVGSARFYLSEVTGSDVWRSPVAMEQTRVPRCTDEVEIIPFQHVTIKQEEVESSDSVDMVASFHEEVDIKEEQDHEMEMDPSLAATMMSVVLKDDSNASSGDVEELIVEPSLLQFKCFHDEDRQEDDEIPSPTMVFVPDTDQSEYFLDEYGNYEHAASESKRLKYALKKFIQTQRSQRCSMPPKPLPSATRSGCGVGGGGGGRFTATAPGAGAGDDPTAVFRCPHCFLCLTSSDYLDRHVRRGCRFRDAPIKNAYRCTQCGTGFSNYGELFQHRRKAHSDPHNPAFRCLECGEGFSHHGELFQHKRKAHSNEVKNAYRCLECGEGFSNYGDLFHHKDRVHQDPLAAPRAASSNTIAPSKQQRQQRPPPHSKDLLPDLRLCVVVPPTPSSSDHRRPPRSSSSSSASETHAPPPPRVLQLGPEVLVTSVSAAPPSRAPFEVPDFTSGLSITPVLPLADVCCLGGAGGPPPRSSDQPRCSSSRPVVVVPPLRASCRTPDLVFSSSSAVNHFAPVVPDVAAHSDLLPDVAAASSSSGSSSSSPPDIVTSCSRPPTGIRHPAATAAASAVSLTATAPAADSLPPDVVAGAASHQGRLKRTSSAAAADRGGPVLPSGGGGASSGCLVRLNCSARKRRNPEPASRRRWSGSNGAEDARE